jgi:hypothetical protein
MTCNTAQLLIIHFFVLLNGFSVLKPSPRQGILNWSLRLSIREELDAKIEMEEVYVFHKQKFKTRTAERFDGYRIQFWKEKIYETGKYPSMSKMTLLHMI